MSFTGPCDHINMVVFSTIFVSVAACIVMEYGPSSGYVYISTSPCFRRDLKCFQISFENIFQVKGCLCRVVLPSCSSMQKTMLEVGSPSSTSVQPNVFDYDADCWLNGCKMPVFARPSSIAVLSSWQITSIFQRQRISLCHAKHTSATYQYCRDSRVICLSHKLRVRVWKRTILFGQTRSEKRPNNDDLLSRVCTFCPENDRQRDWNRIRHAVNISCGVLSNSDLLWLMLLLNITISLINTSWVLIHYRPLQAYPA